MTEMILNSNTLPEPLLLLVRSEKVKVNEENGKITLTPIPEYDNRGDYPLRGSAADCGFTVEEFLARKRAEKELEL